MLRGRAHAPPMMLSAEVLDRERAQPRRQLQHLAIHERGRRRATIEREHREEATVVAAAGGLPIGRRGVGHAPGLHGSERMVCTPLHRVVLTCTPGLDTSTHPFERCAKGVVR